MQFSRNWLAQYVELPDSVDELAERLTAAGLAVEGLEPQGDDVLLDVDVTTNRPDCMNHYGLAREVAILTDQPLQPPDTDAEEAEEDAADVVNVLVENAEECPRYVARVVRGVTVTESPEWLQDRLRSLGMRPINNVVDVTNFVLWETGQPLHAFDLHKLEGPEIRVRRARAGEVLVTLDEEERKLDPEDLIIADAERPVALAGVMGGLDSEVTAETADVLLESAHFHPKRVRRTAKRLGMHTDASHRFERGADPGACRWAADRAAALLAEIAGGTVLDGAVDPYRDMQQPSGPLELDKLRAFGGVDVPADDVERILTGLGFEVESAGPGAWHVTVPTWRIYDFQTRPDTDGETYPQDLYEEVLRVYGFDRIPSTLPAVAGSDGPPTEAQVRRDRMRDVLAACGYAEAIHYAFHDRASDARFPSILGDAEPLELANPLSERYDVMRRSLVPNLLSGALFNLNRGADAVRLFEIGHVFGRAPDADEGDGATDERETAAVVCGGRLGDPWNGFKELDLFDLKGAVERLAEAVLGPGGRLVARPAEHPGVVSGTGADLYLDDRKVGWMGLLDDDETDEDLFAAELETGLLVATPDSTVTPPSRYPSVAVDLTLTHSRDVPWADLETAIRSEAADELLEFGLHDRYEGEGVPEGAVNTSIRFVYGSDERSLTQDEVNVWQTALASSLEERFGESS